MKNTTPSTLLAFCSFATDAALEMLYDETDEAGRRESDRRRASASRHRAECLLAFTTRTGCSASSSMGHDEAERLANEKLIRAFQMRRFLAKRWTASECRASG